MYTYFLNIKMTHLTPSTVPGEECDRACDGTPLHCVFSWTVRGQNASVGGVTREVTVVEDRQVNWSVPSTTRAILSRASTCLDLRSSYVSETLSLWNSATSKYR